jgi:uncharacterized protein involved in tolerance to divalent cations
LKFTICVGVEFDNINAEKTNNIVPKLAIEHIIACDSYFSKTFKIVEWMGKVMNSRGFHKRILRVIR